MKLKVDADDFQKMYRALIGAAPRSLFNATMLRAEGDMLYGITIGDSVYAEYKIVAEVENEGSTVVGNRALNATDIYEGEIELALTASGKTLQARGTQSQDWRTMDVLPETYAMPNGGVMPERFVDLPPNVKNIVYVYDKPDIQQGKDAVWIKEDKLYCGNSFRMAYTWCDTQILDRVVSVKAPLLNRAADIESRIGFTENHVWVASGALLVCMPHTNVTIHTASEIVMGYGGFMEELASFSVDRHTIFDHVAALTKLAITNTDTAGTLRMTLAADGVSISTYGAEIGSGDTTIAITDRCGEFDIGVGGIWLRTSLLKCEDDVVRISYNRIGVSENDAQPGLVCIADENSRHFMMSRTF